jgi:6-phospho-3-hexuloisomerase
VRQIFEEISKVHKTLSQNAVQLLCSEIQRCEGAIVGLGAGRMGYSLQAFMMRLSHLGYASYMIGDTTLPRIGRNDLVIVNSSSGETPSVMLLANIARDHGAKIIGITSGKKSTLSKICDLNIFYDEINSDQLMKTIYEQFTYLFFDMCAGELSKSSKLSIFEIEKNHSILE